MKKEGKIAKVAFAMPALACKMFHDTETETFYDDPYDVDEPNVSWFLGQGNTRQAPQFGAAAVPNPKHWIIITGATIA